MRPAPFSVYAGREERVFMSLISLAFLLFFIILCIVYYLVEGKHQWKVLLIGSIVFYAFAGLFCLVFISISVVITWFFMRKPDKPHLLITLAINLGILIAFRYSIYFGIHDLIIPLGISFYTFMTLGYALDCYDGKIKPCTNPFHYALYIFYFPQITQGPIGTWQNMMPALLTPHAFDPENIKEGGYRIIKGCFKKLVIAGRLSFYVDTVFSSPGGFGGLTLITAVFFYAIELYADFSGYMDIACGISRMLGIKLAENFNRPYFSRNIPEYWRRWHITLNEWFTAHLFMPAVTSKWNKKAAKAFGKLFPKAKKGTLRTILPLILVWITTGIWHGAEAVYIGWGVYFAVIMLLSFCTASYMKTLKVRIHWNDENVWIRIFQTLRTFIIVCIGEVMFRAETLPDAFTIYHTIFTNTRINGSAIAAALTPFGNGNQAAASIIIVGLLILGLFMTELQQELHPDRVLKHRYFIAGALLTVTILFGMAGQSNFMYQSF